MHEIRAGRPLVDLLSLAYGADQPVLLHGRHGVGKSALVEQAAQQLNVQFIVRDLSLMEPPDLVGIPRVSNNGRTHYAAPSFLPVEGKGIIMLEELNRAPSYMHGPCLQLLTARCLNDYNLPSGWVPFAAVNSPADGYQVAELDDATLSRFLQAKVIPDVEEWIAWARAGGQIHERIVQFVQNSARIFDDPDANPRAWEYASRFLKRWEDWKGTDELLATGLAGLVGDKWAAAFMRSYASEQGPLTDAEIVESYPRHRSIVRGWVSRARLDLVAASLENLKRYLQPQRVFNSVVNDSTKTENVRAFASDLPPDLRRQFKAWLKNRAFKGLLPTRRASL